MTKLKMLWPILIVMLLAGVGPNANYAFGQATNTGTVVGAVEDQSGAVVPGAAVTLTDPSTNAARTTVTNRAGQYAFVNVSPSVYSITASKTGFQMDKTDNLT